MAALAPSGPRKWKMGNRYAAYTTCLHSESLYAPSQIKHHQRHIGWQHHVSNAALLFCWYGLIWKQIIMCLKCVPQSLVGLIACMPSVYFSVHSNTNSPTGLYQKHLLCHPEIQGQNAIFFPRVGKVGIFLHLAIFFTRVDRMWSLFSWQSSSMLNTNTPSHIHCVKNAEMFTSKWTPHWHMCTQCSEKSELLKLHGYNCWQVS